MIITFNNIQIKTSDTVYTPAEDSFFLEDSLIEILTSEVETNKFKKIAEMGVGSGYITILLMKLFPKSFFFAIDKNKQALEITLENIHLNSLSNTKFELIHSDLFSNVSENAFDLIIFNPPYLPVEENLQLDDTDPMYRITWEGGDQVITEFLQTSEKKLNDNGEIVLLLSQYQVKNGQLHEFIQQINSNLQVIRSFKKRLSLETLYIAVLTKRKSS